MVYKQDNSLGFLFSRPDILGGLTFFKNKEEGKHIYRPDLLGGLTFFGKKKEWKHIYRLNLAPPHDHANLRISVIISLILLHHFYHPQIANAYLLQLFLYIQLADNIKICH